MSSSHFCVRIPLSNRHDQICSTLIGPIIGATSSFDSILVGIGKLLHFVESFFAFAFGRIILLRPTTFPRWNPPTVVERGVNPQVG